jgi:hypothetical protein
MVEVFLVLTAGGASPAPQSQKKKQSQKQKQIHKQIEDEI